RVGIRGPPRVREPLGLERPRLRRDGRAAGVPVGVGGGGGEQRRRLREQPRRDECECDRKNEKRTQRAPAGGVSHILSPSIWTVVMLRVGPNAAQERLL